MKRIAFTVSVAVLVIGLVILARTQTASVEQELIKMETQWGEAWTKHDATSVDKLLADDFMVTMPDGSVLTKAQILEVIRSYKEEVTSLVTDEWKVRVYGDAAVVTARNTYKMQSAGKEDTFHERFTDTWIKREGQWRCVAAHNSSIAQK
jgi:uncharacterized protein (TIGR02246 family)